MTQLTAWGDSEIFLFFRPHEYAPEIFPTSINARDPIIQELCLPSVHRGKNESRDNKINYHC